MTALSELPEIYCLTVNKTQDGELHVQVERLISAEQARDIATDLYDEGLYSDAMVYDALARAVKKAGIPAFWDIDSCCRPTDLDDFLYRDYLRADKRDGAHVYAAREPALDAALAGLRVPHHGGASEIDAVLACLVHAQAPGDPEAEYAIPSSGF